MPSALPFSDVGSYTGVALYLLLWIVVFVESGLLVGFFLPGDTVLFAAGVACAGGRGSIYVLCAGIVVAAVLGDALGYTIGRRAGRPLLERRNGRVLNQHNLHRATAFYDRYGSATIVIARVVPMLRTFAPLIAGCTQMPYRRFVTWNVLGGLAWGIGVPGAGYLIGESVPGLERYALGLAVVMAGLSLIPAAIHYVRSGRHGEPGVLEEQADVLEDADLLDD